MDPQVLIKAIEALQTILSRINSKRIMVFYAYLLFLVYCEPNSWKMALGGMAFLITLYMVWKQPKNTDGL